MTGSPYFPDGRPVALDDRVQVWADGSVILGGAPWGVLRIAPAGRAFVRRLSAAGASGLVPAPGVELTITDRLLARGIVHPVALPANAIGAQVDVVVPAYGRPQLLERCLGALRSASPAARIIVVDDASPGDAVAGVARAHGATLLRHPVNRGPAAARNTGLAESTSPIVAFVDADCAVTDGWLAPLVAHFDDPRVAAVAPRIVARSTGRGLFARYGAQRSVLDMGPRPALVTHGAPVGYLPSAALLLRRSAVAACPFDEELRVGEDVDLIWRLIDAGRLVRFEPVATVAHASPPSLFDWARRLFGYGISAAALDHRHPDRLVPARLSGWSIGIAALVLARRPSAAYRLPLAAAVAALASGLLSRSFRSSPQVAPFVIGKTMVSDAESVGHLLRREWWPIGWLAIVLAWRSRVGMAAAAAMVIPVTHEWFAQRPGIDLPRYLALRLVEDASYGSGVIAGAVSGQRPAVLLPRVRLPYLRRRTPGAQAPT